MSTSLLYHRFGIRGPFHYCSTEFDGNVTIFHIAHNTHIKCPSCRSRDVIKKKEVRFAVSLLPQLALAPVTSR
jgi:DNA-directed RNA polymerase subunit RPC12/RpoP